MTTASGYVSIHIHHLYMLITGINWITRGHWFITRAATHSDNKSTSHLNLSPSHRLFTNTKMVLLQGLVIESISGKDYSPPNMKTP
jgi:hypothetical protein